MEIGEGYLGPMRRIANGKLIVAAGTSPDDHGSAKGMVAALGPLKLLDRGARIHTPDEALFVTCLSLGTFLIIGFNDSGGDHRIFRPGCP